MQEFEVTRIRLEGGETHEYITHIGGINWTLTKEQAIADLDNKRYRLFVRDRFTNKISYVGVVKPFLISPYLRTYADGDWNNNLLALPRF